MGLGTFISGRGYMTVQTLGEGEVLGWSRMVPPYIWHLNAQAMLPTLALVLDGTRLPQNVKPTRILAMNS